MISQEIIFTDLQLALLYLPFFLVFRRILNLFFIRRLIIQSLIGPFFLAMVIKLLFFLFNSISLKFIKLGFHFEGNWFQDNESTCNQIREHCSSIVNIILNKFHGCFELAASLIFFHEVFPSKFLQIIRLLEKTVFRSSFCLFSFHFLLS